jgi:hypothetical protein
MHTLVARTHKDMAFHVCTLYLKLWLVILTPCMQYEGVKGVVCGPEGTHLAGGCVLSKLR